ncbi:MAG: acyl-CoA dehydrogenase [Lachnospiraceae bacterium]|nr:acyl-CoA dehydrogenase [Lachnospiraceae bacterium]
MSEYRLMTEDQRDMVELVKGFLMKEYLPLVPEYDQKGEYPMEIHKKMGDLGLFAMDIPEEYGGLGLDAVSVCLIREAMGYVDAGFASSFSASTFGIKPVLLAGTEEQKKAYGARLAEGQISAMCLTEPQSGSDMGNTKCKAVRDGDSYILNGTKCFITNGGIADIFTVAAATAPELRNNGISLFIVDRNAPGVSVGKEENKLGIRTSNTTDVIFEDVRVPASALIGEENAGFAISQKLLARTRPTGMAAGIGLAQRALDLAIDYAQQRITFGKPIASRQAIKFKLADMEIKIQTARAQLLYNAMLIDQGIYDSLIGSITKTYVSEVAFEVANEAVQIFGGYGYSREYPVEKLLRDARIYSLFEGTNEIQRMVIGGALAPKKKA